MRNRVGLVTIFLFAAASCLPYVWLVYTAFRPRTVITASPPEFSVRWTLENFSLFYNGQSLLDLMRNSIIISIGTVILSLSIGLPAAYYFARERSRWTKGLFLFVLSTRMAPPVALSLPMFVVFTEIGLRSTYLSVIITESIFNIAFVVWFLEASISGIPREAEMAAQVDGRSRLGSVITVVVPSLIPAITATAAFVFLFSWNEYMIASLLSSSSTRPVTPALPGFIAQATSQWGAFCAVAFLSSIPALVLAVVARRFIARAFTVGIISDA
jgi:multiple sugar transport system permease protein